ncbi:MAG: ferrous iron transport protein B [Armatimonadetes bacterium]|nr:ferrous iron transport protein B [Armatimonadota bacterium]
MSIATPTQTAAGSRIRYVALAGNPNSGKTTLFNALTGLRHRVGNYPGVTVERREGRLAGNDITVLDLPGTYSLNARSPDEEIARDALLGRHPPVPELVIVVVDASNLERNLYLVTQVMDLGLPVVLCLNMTDQAERVGLQIDIQTLERELGIPVIPTVASRGKGLDDLRMLLQGAPPSLPVRRWRLPEAMKAEVVELAHLLVEERLCAPESAFFTALALLSDATGLSVIQNHPRARAAVDRAWQRLEAADVDPQSAPVEARYEWIKGICDRATRQGEIPITWSDRVDRIATHKVWGFVLFFALMALIFQAIFTWAQAPMSWIETAQTWLGEQAGALLPQGDLRSLVVDGVIAGVGGVIVFLPQILCLFFFIGLLEDSGYMARAAFVMDRLMSKVGLHGKSFIPLLSSFACAIPGIMATRTIENRRDRMATILVAPLMSCSARLPIYTLLIAGFIPATRLWGGISLPAAVMVSLYLLGLTAALLMALLFKRTLFRGEAPLFLMELPPYKLPAMRTVLLQTWERGSHFLRRAGTIILAISILLWFAMKYPGSPSQSDAARLQQSVAGRAGRLLEPVIRPFGMDWKVGIGILGSFAAREVFVTTMAIVYNVEDGDEERQSVSVRQQMREEIDPATRKPRFTPAAAAALMVFYVLAMQCVSTMAVVRRETGSWKWPLFQWAYMFVLAWTGATAVFHLGRLLGLG